MWSALVLIALTQANPICWKVSGVTKCVPEGNRVTHGEHTARAGGRSGSPPPFFQFAPTSGAGMSAACACTAVTGTKGEAVTWTRAGSAYCTKEGLATTGLTTASMVLCGSNIPRVEADSNGVLGVLVEAARTNDAIQSESFDNIAWTSTATVTADIVSAPWGTTTADRLLDSSAVAIQSSCQTITTASATQHTFSVYLSAATIAAAGITMTGTGSSTGDCSATTTTLSGTYTRLSCSSPAAYGALLTGVTVCVQVGTVVGDTGAIYATGAQHENTAPYGTSYTPTTTVAVARVKDNTSVNASTFPTVSYSKAVSITTPWSSANAPATPGLLLGEVSSTSGSDLFIASGGLRIQNLNAGAFQSTSGTLNIVANTTARLAGSSGGGFVNHYKDGVLIQGPTALTMAAAPTSNTTGIADDTVGVSHLDGIISKICWDANSLRCR